MMMMMVGDGGDSLTECLECQRGEQDKKNRNQILESDYTQVAVDTSDLENSTLFSVAGWERSLLHCSVTFSWCKKFCI